MASSFTVLAALIEALDQQRNSDNMPYVDPSYPQSAVLDGTFNLQEMAEHMAESLSNQE